AQLVIGDRIVASGPGHAFQDRLDDTAAAEPAPVLLVHTVDEIAAAAELVDADEQRRINGRPVYRLAQRRGDAQLHQRLQPAGRLAADHPDNRNGPAYFQSIRFRRNVEVGIDEQDILVAVH